MGTFRSITYHGAGADHLYDPATGQWSEAGETRDPRAESVTIKLTDGTVMVAGGIGRVGSVEVWNPATGQWTYVGDLVETRYRHAAALLPDGRVLITGGVGIVGVLAESEIYEP